MAIVRASLRGATGGALLGASLGISGAIAHRYFELGFWRGTTHELVASSATFAVAFGVAALGGALLARSAAATAILRADSMPWAGLAATAIGLLAFGGAFVAGFVGPIDFAAGAIASIACGAFVGAMPRFGRAQGADGGRRVVAIGFAFAILLVGGYVQNRPWLRAPFATANVVGNGLVVASAMAAFALARAEMRWVGSIAVAIAVAIAACALLVPTDAVSNRKSVVIIAIDTLRFDHSSLAGVAQAAPEDRDRTPNLLRLARSGSSFEHAISQAPWTLPAFASIVTGLYPDEHGAISLNDRIERSVVTFAEVLREAGYTSKGIVSHLFVDAHHGFAQGFDSYDESHVVGHVGKTSRGQSDLAIEFLERSAGRATPFLLFVHYFDPHYEYEDHEGFDYADGYEGPLRDTSEGIEALRARREELTDADLRYLRDLYDEEIASTDREIGRVLDALARLGLQDEVAVVVVADHGEEFMEHGWLGHSSSLYEPVIRVPMVLRLPGVAPTAPIETPVETRAIFPTLVDYLGVDVSVAPRDGSLLPLMRGEPFASAPVRSMVDLSDISKNNEKHVRAWAVRDGRYKYVLDATRGVERLFDLESDPGESNDLSQSEPDLRARLREQLDARMGEAASSLAPELDEEERERLRALGYL